MTATPVATVFRPDPMCLDPTNIWLYSTPCAQQGDSFLSSCTAASQGDPAGSTLCQPGFQRASQYSGCPEGYTEAGLWAGGGGGGEGFEGTTISTFCCPGVHDYSHYGRTFTKSVDGGASNVLFIDHPGCVATSVDVLRSLTVTVTLGNEPGHATTTTAWADDEVLFVDAVTVIEVQYRDYTAFVSTCLGGDCPARWTPTFAIPVETPPLAQYTPPPECTNPDDLWLVTTACQITSPSLRVVSPSWLQCTVTALGPPLARDFSYCALPRPYQADGTQYTGCPAGYTPAATQTNSADVDRWHRYARQDLDVAVHVTHCCPAQYDFQIDTEVPGIWNEFTTVHEGQEYGVSQWQLPGCFATSVSALSGREVPLQQYRHRALDYPRVADEEGPPTTAAWDYERATLFAQARYVSRTVFQGTHTCYDEPCHSWMAYYYSDGTRPPLSAATPATTGGSRSPPDATTSGAGPTETGGDPNAGTRQVASGGRRWLGIVSLLVVGLAL